VTNRGTVEQQLK